MGPCVRLVRLVNHIQEKSPCFEGALLKYTTVTFCLRYIRAIEVTIEVTALLLFNLSVVLCALSSGPLVLRFLVVEHQAE